MKNLRKSNRVTFLLILILVVTIGYAALSTQLKINGTVNVAKTTWDVHFENVNIKEGSVNANPAPTTNNTDTTEMTYTINFTKPGDYFEFTVDVVNKGTLDAMVDLVSNKAFSSNGTTEINLPSYLISTVTYDGGASILQNQLLAKNSSQKIRVRVEFKKNIQSEELPSDGNTTIVFKFNGKYVQATEEAEEVIDPCPGCVYAYPLYSYTITGNSYTVDIDNTINWGKEGDILTPNQYKTSYNELVAETGKKIFIGIILNNENRAIRGFACGIHNEKLFCAEGISFEDTDYYNDEELERIYNRNKKVLQSVWDNTCEAPENGGSISCIGDEKVYATISDHSSSEDEETTCWVAYNGTLSCYEKD